MLNRPTEVGDTPAVRMLGRLIQVVAVTLLISLTVTLLMLRHAGRVQDAAAANASMVQFQGLLAAEGRQLATHVRDYSIWDEAIERLIVHPDVDWWDANPGPHAIATIGVSLSMVVSGTDQVQFATTAAGTRRAIPAMALSPSLRALLSAARQRPASASTEAAVAIGLVEFGDTLYLAAASRFLGEEHPELPATDPDAVMLFGDGLDDRVLPEIVAIMGDLELQRLAKSPVGAVQVPLILADDRPAGVVAWEPPQPGHALLMDVIPLIIGGFLIVVSLSVLFAIRARTFARQLYTDDSLRSELAQRNESILEAVGEGIFGIDRTGRIQFLNPAAQQLLGYSESELLGQDANDLVAFRQSAGQRVPDADSPLRRTLADGRAVTSESEYFKRKDGGCFPIEYVVTPMRSAQEVTGAVVVFRDITKRRETEEEVLYRANYDALTSLPNRNLLFERLNQELKLARRESKRVGVLFTDLDRFKEVNDSLGHWTGDLLLRQVALRLQGSVRDTDTVGRLGGDEFVILLPYVYGVGDPGKIAGKVLDALQAPFDLEGHTVQVEASIGIALFPEDGDEVGTLIHQADMAMYQAKSAGRATYRYASGTCC